MDVLIRKNRELSVILEVSRVLTSSFNLDENLASVMKRLNEQLEMQRGCVFLLDPISRELRIVAACGLTSEEIKRGKYRIGEGIVGRVLETGNPMIIPNIGEESKFLNRTGSRPAKTGISFLCMPISFKGEVFGVISVDRIYSPENGNVEDDERVLQIIASLIAQFIKLWEAYKKTEVECGALRSQLREHYSLPNIIGESRPLQHVLKTVRKVASTDTTVLLLGESGTGKELIAQTLHYQSDRTKGAFVPVNLAALPENLIEAELFGVEKGGFTGATTRRIGRFEMADNGTLFLDEIGELPLPVQVKLLRVLQERTFERIGSNTPIHVNVRVVAATNRNLMEEVQIGNFREDLFWRLNVVPIELPPLRERRDDIGPLIYHYLEKFNRKYGHHIQLKDRTVSKLVSYDWPGNVRELANTVERIVIMADHGAIAPDALPEYLKNACSSTRSSTTTSSDKNNLSYPANLGNEVRRLEQNRIIVALKENNFNQRKASKVLGITTRQLGYRIKKYGIVYKRL